MKNITIDEVTVAYCIGRELANSTSFKSSLKEKMFAHKVYLEEGAVEGDNSPIAKGYIKKYTNEELCQQLDYYGTFKAEGLIRAIKENPLSDEALEQVLIAIQRGLEDYDIYTRADGDKLWYDEEIVSLA
jgi:hypothetical protein